MIKKRSMPLTVRIVLSNSVKCALIDRDDFWKVMQYRWFIDANGYAVHDIWHNNKPVRILMHRLIMGLSSPDVDHRDRNKLNNRKRNLRHGSSGLHKHNRRVPNTTGYKGVFINRQGKFFAQIKVEYKARWLGVHETAEDAAKIYDAEARLIYGKEADTNFVY